MSNTKTRLKKAVIIRHRKDKNLCTRCGKSISDECINELCIENYNKADNRSSDQIIPVTESERKRNTILYYRKQKKLCLRCGNELHEGACIEDYNKSDNRSESDKKFRPAIVKTPKAEKKFIIDALQTNNKPTILLTKTKDIYLQRSAILISLNRSNNGNTIEYSCISQLSKKFCDYIIILLGDSERYFPYSDYLKLKSLTNIMRVTSMEKQDVINHLHAVKKYFAYENEYIDYCKRNNISFYQFPNNKNVTNILNLSAYQI